MPLRPPPLAAVALLGLTLTGCRLGVGAEVDIDRDGSGSVAVAATLDRALLTELDQLGVDPTAELSAIAGATPDWDVTRTRDDDGGLTVTLTREASDAAELTDALRELTAGLVDTDPALALDLELDVDETGAAQLAGTAELRTPIGPGLITDGEAADELAALAADTVDAQLVVSFPGPVTDADADTIDGRTATWLLEPGDPRPLSATAATPPWWTAERVAALLAGVLVLVSSVTLGVVLVRRRRPG